MSVNYYIDDVITHEIINQLVRKRKLIKLSDVTAEESNILEEPTVLTPLPNTPTLAPVISSINYVTPTKETKKIQPTVALDDHPSVVQAINSIPRKGFKTTIICARTRLYNVGNNTNLKWAGLGTLNRGHKTAIIILNADKKQISKKPNK